MASTAFILVVIHLLVNVYSDSNRLLLQNSISCANCVNIPCTECVAGECLKKSGCCETEADCGANQLCNGGECVQQVIQPGQWWPCQRQFCACPLNYDPVYCISGRIYSNECAAQCNCEINCFKICKSNSECPSNSNRVCVDIPNDACDPNNGDAGCDGYCLGPMIAIGRPYNLDDKLMDLKADLQPIDCANYKFYFNDIQRLKMNHTVSNEVINDWINKALSEHAAVATFAKFNLDLMSISAPVWLLEMSTRAALDEIEHAKISFDILNQYIINNNKYNNISKNKCIVYNSFPAHEIQIDADYNRISLDAAIGGCFGETLSAFKAYFHTGMDTWMIDSYLKVIAMDEIRHSSLAWVTVKWMIDQRGDEIEVRDVKWWEQQLLQRTTYSKIHGVDKYGVEEYVNEVVIPAISKLLWTNVNDSVQTYDYSGLYNEIVQLLEKHWNIYSKKQLV